MSPASVSGHCRVTVVAPNMRVDVALPEDVPLAELLPDVLRLVTDHSGSGSGAGFGGGLGPGAGVGAGFGSGSAFGSGSGAGSGVGSGSGSGPGSGFGGVSSSGYVLTGPGGRILDTSQSLHAQGVVHGDLMRLRSVGDLPEAPVHDDIVDAVAEAVLGGGRMWTAKALRIASLTGVALALGLGAVALWFSASRAPGSFHGQAAAVAALIAMSLLAGGVWRARYDVPTRGRASYYISSSGARTGHAGPAGVPGTDSERDYAAATVLTTCALPYAFIAGFGLLPTDLANGLGRSQVTTGSAALLIVALAAMVGLGRRISAAVAGAVVGFAGTAAGVGMAATNCDPVSAVAIVAACCAVAVEALPFVAMYVARFIIEAPSMSTEPGDFDGSPVDIDVVTLRVERTREMLAGLVAGVSVLMVASVAMLVVPVAAFGTSLHGDHSVWEQALAGIVAAAALCRARMFRERGPVAALVAAGLAGVALVGGAVVVASSPAVRGTWILAGLAVAASVGLALSTVRARRGTTVAVLPPQWGRMVDVLEGALMLGVLPVMLAVLGVYGRAKGMHA